MEDGRGEIESEIIRLAFSGGSGLRVGCRRWMEDDLHGRHEWLSTYVRVIGR